MTSDTRNLLTPVRIGAVELTNRIVMAPMTRNRAGEGLAPTAMNAKYYEQRASAGLIVTEASQVAERGIGYPGTPGIYSDAQVDGWRLVTKSVHDRGGKIFLQLWHVGRISHPSLQPNGDLPVAPSAIAPEGECFTYEGLQPFVTPRALETSEIGGIVKEFAHGAAMAKSAGFDGVEIHAANGYLIDQFLQDNSNVRTDGYGGSVANRARFMLEVTEAVVDVWGASRVGIRLSPRGTFNSMGDSDRLATFSYAVEKLAPLNLAYLHLIEPIAGAMSKAAVVGDRLLPRLRQIFHGPIIANGGYDRESAEAVLGSGDADLVAFGVPFIANPDLPARFATGAALARADSSLFYTGGERGYVDYPALEVAQR